MGTMQAIHCHAERWAAAADRWPTGRQQYKADTAGPPPSEMAPAIAQALDPKGFQISAQRSAYCEIWFRTQCADPARASSERNVTLPFIPQGALVGVIRFDGQDWTGAARRSGRRNTRCVTG